MKLSKNDAIPSDHDDYQVEDVKRLEIVQNEDVATLKEVEVACETLSDDDQVSVYDDCAETDDLNHCFEFVCVTAIESEDVLIPNLLYDT